MLLRQSAHATGFEEPTRWLERPADPSEKPPLLVAPEFYFEIEVKRLAAELKPYAKAVPPPLKDGSRDYAEQTGVADTADFEDALKTGAIKPADAKKAADAHAAMRARIAEVTRTPQDDNAAPQARKSAPAPNDNKPLPGEFPSEFADYNKGALAFCAGNFDEAKTAWEALLKRPDAERRYRTTWAIFMLGKIAIEEEKFDDARAWFVKTREAAADGFRDSLGLAAASIGWEAFANLHSGRLSEAARLYLDQLASGDLTAVASLRAVMDEIFMKKIDLAVVARDPVLQRIATAGAVSDMGPFGDIDNVDAGKEARSLQWLRALEKIDAKNVRDADRLAWIAHAHGDYERAARWLKRADENGTYALWLRAKLALRDGKLDAATQLLSKAVRQIPAYGELETRTLEGYTAPDTVAKGDLGALLTGRGEFLNAFHLFAASGHWGDAAYIAERVLAPVELIALVEKEFQLQPEDEKMNDQNDLSGASAGFGLWRGNTSLSRAMRWLLARRLTRLGRFDEARPYFPKAMREKLDTYVASLKQSDKKSPVSERIAALWKAAQIARSDGMELMGTEIGPDAFDYGGEFADVNIAAQRIRGKFEEEYQVRKNVDGDKQIDTHKRMVPLVPPATAAERKRLAKSRVTPEKRFHYRYVAADLAWQAATLMSDNDEHTAEVLNTAGSWLKDRDDDAADRFYQAIEKRCPKTELGKEAIKRHWFVPVEESK